MTALKLSLKRQLLLLGAILTLANLGMVLHRSSRVYLFQQTQCFNYYTLNDPSQIDPHSRIQESLCKLREIQAPLSITDGIDSFLAKLPGRRPFSTRHGPDTWNNQRRSMKRVQLTNVQRCSCWPLTRSS